MGARHVLAEDPAELDRCTAVYTVSTVDRRPVVVTLVLRTNYEMENRAYTGDSSTSAASCRHPKPEKFLPYRS